MSKNISIIGSGWLGLDLAKSLIKDGYSVSSSTTSESKIKSLKSFKIKPYKFKINEIKADSDFLNSTILIICITHKNLEDFKHLANVISESTIAKVIFISSISVYNNSNSEVDENTPTNNSQLSKIEQILLSIPNLQLTILRLGGLFGEDRNPANFFAKDRVIPNPEGYINFVHKIDCINVIKEVIEQNCWNQVFNIVADNHPTRREFYTSAIKKTHGYTPIFDKNSINEWKIVSNEKVKTCLNYSFKFEPK